MIKKAASLLMPRLLGRVPKNLRILYPFYLAGKLNTVHRELPLANLPPALDGLSIAYASDIHFGPLFHQDEALALYNALLKLGCDLIILGGDYGDVLENAIRFFELLPAFPEELPVLAVLGNHDYGRRGQPIEPLLAAMRSKQVTPLVNQCYLFERAGASLAVCAPDDLLCGRPDLEALKRGAQGVDLVLFTPHSPDLLPEAYAAGFRFDLALCGHTHGGQITLFGRSLHSSSRYGDRYRAGWYAEQGAAILVSEGVGTSILPMRLGTQSQIHRLVLRGKG